MIEYKNEEERAQRGEPAARGWTCKGSRFLEVPCFVYFSVSAALILAGALWFQMQVAALERELEEVKAKLSDRIGSEEVSVKSLRKRSSEEEEEPFGRSSGVQGLHLQGSFPFQHIQKQGRIGPWSPPPEKSFISLKEKSTEIKINQGGLYFVYAQVHYLTSNPHNSYQILTHNGTEEKRNHRVLSTCSSQGRNSVGNVSCYTGFARTFSPGDRLYLNQVEQNRIIHFNNGCSFFGIVLLHR